MRNSRRKNRRARAASSDNPNKGDVGGGGGEESKEVRDVKSLAEAFSLVSLGDVCSAYKEAQGDLNKAADILGGLLVNDDDPSERFFGSTSSSSEELFSSGTETSSSAIEWAMAELTKSPHIATKLRAELSSVVGQRTVKESDLPNLPYLQAITKETLRLHPSTPLCIPRRAPETCQVMNHTIPKDCQILVNVWAIGRDPKAWKDANKFSPERFLNSNIDYKGNDFELIPFSAGRRICPGMPLAIQSINLIVATLVQNFEWDLPNGKDPKDLVMDDKFGLTLQKEPPLYIIPKSRV